MMEGLQARDPSSVAEAIAFLEEESEEPFMGYERERVYGYLTHIDLTDDEAGRLRAFVLKRCREKRFRHELRKLRVLARSLATDQFVADLRALPRSDDAKDQAAEAAFVESVQEVVSAGQ